MVFVSEKGYRERTAPCVPNAFRYEMIAKNDAKTGGNRMNGAPDEIAESSPEKKKNGNKECLQIAMSHTHYYTRTSLPSSFVAGGLENGDQIFALLLLL